MILPSLENYLKAIFALDKTDKSIRLVDIAERLSVTKPSAYNAVVQLKNRGLVEHTPQGPILLTDKGRNLAEKLVEKQNVIKHFLIDVLNIDEGATDSEADAISHSISEITLR